MTRTARLVQRWRSESPSKLEYLGETLRLVFHCPCKGSTTAICRARTFCEYCYFNL